MNHWEKLDEWVTSKLEVQNPPIISEYKDFLLMKHPTRGDECPILARYKNTRDIYCTGAHTLDEVQTSIDKVKGNFLGLF